jgi:hypothetical protein
VYAGVLAFNLAVTVLIGDLPLAAASAAVAAATLGGLAWRFGRAPRAEPGAASSPEAAA